MGPLISECVCGGGGSHLQSSVRLSPNCLLKHPARKDPAPTPQTPRTASPHPACKHPAPPPQAPCMQTLRTASPSTLHANTPHRLPEAPARLPKHPACKHPAPPPQAPCMQTRRTASPKPPPVSPSTLHANTSHGRRGGAPGSALCVR
ncbi:unnamed protein product [Gadus morhua 'NCC']